MRPPYSVTALLFGVMLLGAACSPNVYKQEIGDFAKAMKKTQSVFEELRKQDYEARIEVVTRDFLGDPSAKLKPVLNCPNVDPKQCGLVMTFKDGTKLPFPEEKNTPKISEILGQMVAYAEGLASVAGSDDADAVNEAAGKLSLAIGQLAKAVQKSSKKVDASVGFLESAFKWIVGAYVDQKRYRTLQNAVSVAYPLVTAAGKELKKVVKKFFNRVTDNKKNSLENRAGDLRRPDFGDLNRVEKWALAKALAEESRTLRVLTQQKPENLIDKMVEAHTALKEALEDESKQAEVVFAQIQAFADLVEALSKALKAS